MRQFNPVMNAKVLDGQQGQSALGQMTLTGTIQKTGILLGLLMISATYSWSQMVALGDQAAVVAQKYILISAIVGFGVALMTIFMKQYAGFLAPLYALIQGFLLGALSMVFESMFPGIVFQAVLGTFGVLAAMLFLYQNRIIRVTDKFRSIVITATFAVAFTYLISIVLSFFGISVGFIHSNGLMGIGFSLVVIGIASMNLLLDFDMIEKYNGRVPKYMEWFCAFGIMVTLIWLYMEILRLLAKLHRR